MLLRILFAIKWANQVLIEKDTRIHENDILQVNPFKPVQNWCHICHIFLESLESASGLKSHVKAHEWELIINQNTWPIMLAVKTANICHDTVVYMKHCLPRNFYLEISSYWSFQKTANMTFFTDNCSWNFFFTGDSVCFHCIDCLFDVGY